MKTKLKVSIKDANAAEKDGVELYQEMQCCSVQVTSGDARLALLICARYQIHFNLKMWGRGNPSKNYVGAEDMWTISTIWGGKN